MKTLASHPGAGVFRSTVVIIIIAIFISAFFYYTQGLNRRVEVLAKDRIVTDMRLALSMMLYDFAIKGELSNLKKFDRENPFVPLALYRSLPQNYHGTILDKQQIAASGWYFDTKRRRAIYRFTSQAEDEEFVLYWKYEDTNRNGIQDRDEVGYLELKKA